MKLRTWSIYRKSDGVLTGQRLQARILEEISGNESEAVGLIEGEFDHLAERVDLQTLSIVDYQPPQPDEFHEWDSISKRWRLTDSRQQAIRDDISARSQLEALDRKMLRALAEDRLGIKPSKADRDAGAMTLDEIQAAKNALRSKLIDQA